MTYVIIARWRPRDGEREKIEAILRELAKEVRRQEPGNLQFIVNRSMDDPNEFLLYEQYASEQAFRNHQQTEHFRRLVLEQAVPLLARREREAFAVLD
jgi:quinol monooxygenase YgiN